MVVKLQLFVEFLLSATQSCGSQRKVTEIQLKGRGQATFWEEVAFHLECHLRNVDR